MNSTYTAMPEANREAVTSRPPEANERVSLADQLRGAEERVRIASEALLSRCHSKEAREATVKSIAKAKRKVSSLKFAIVQERYAAAKVEADARRMAEKNAADAKANEPKPAEIVLANANTTVRFTVHGETVTVATTKDGERFPIRLTMSIEQGRAEYSRLLRCGYQTW
jgi:hypothetical protein